MINKVVDVVPFGLIAIATVASLPLSAGEAPPEPDTYRMENYRAPTPQTLAGARVLTTSEAEIEWRNGAVFVDVLPRPPKPESLPEGTIWREPPRPNIPGSIWLPDTGYGELAPSIEDYPRSGLARAIDGGSSKTLVIYCLKDCWMSWNAAKRAISFGYSNVAWYPEGTDGWGSAGLRLENSEPEPRRKK